MLPPVTLAPKSEDADPGQGVKGGIGPHRPIAALPSRIRPCTGVPGQGEGRQGDDVERHAVLSGAYPSPRSARRTYDSDVTGRPPPRPGHRRQCGRRESPSSETLKESSASAGGRRSLCGSRPGRGGEPRPSETGLPQEVWPEVRPGKAALDSQRGTLEPLGTMRTMPVRGREPSSLAAWSGRKVADSCVLRRGRPPCRRGRGPHRVCTILKAPSGRKTLADNRRTASRNIRIGSSLPLGPPPLPSGSRTHSPSARK